MMDLLRHSSSQYCSPILRRGAGVSSSHKQHLNILQSMGQSIHVFDSTGLTIYWNKSAENLYGYSASEALGRNILALLVDAVDDAIDIIQKNAAGEKCTGTFPVKNKQGKRFEVIATNTPLYDDYGSIVGIIAVSAESRSFLQLPSVPSSEADSIFSQPTSGPCRLRGDVPQSSFGVSYRTFHPGTSYRYYVGESKIGIPKIFTSRGESWISKKQISQPWKGSEHDGLVARNTHGIFGWLRNEQEDNSCQTKSSNSYEKPEIQQSGSNRFGNEAYGS